MVDKASVTLSTASTDDSELIRCHVSILDPLLIGHTAQLEAITIVKVHDSRGIDAERCIWSKSLDLVSAEIHLEIPRSDFGFYSYSGKNIDLEIHTTLKVDDALIFDTKISSDQLIELGFKTPGCASASSIVEPKDIFSFSANLRAIPVHNQFIVGLLLAIGTLIFCINTLIGAHDQVVPEARTYIYSHYDSDGDSESPLLDSLFTSGLLGAGLFFLIRLQLRKYMVFKILTLQAFIERGTPFNAAALVEGSSRVPLEDVTLRVVGCNLECGQYLRGSGTNERTVSFKEPVRGVILYEKRIPLIPANTPIGPYLDGVFHFDKFFDVLYPPAMLKETHGVEIYWEIQLLHPDFVDQELVGPTDLFNLDHFWCGGAKRREEKLFEGIDGTI